MDEIDARDSKLNRQPQNSGDAAPNNGERVRCRNLRCRCKLGAPTDNHHKAFCSQYCYDQFYRWKCVVCEKELPREGRRRTLCRGHKCRLDYRKFRPTYSLSNSVELPRGPKCKSDSKNPCKTDTFFRVGAGPGWRWEARADEHRLFLRDDHVVIISGVEGDWRVTYPRMIPIQSAPGLEAARKLAIKVAFWTWPIGGIKPKPVPQEKPTEVEWRKRDAADEQYVAADEERLRTEPVDLSGNYAPRDSGEWIDWPPDEDAP
jgi:hypothetical protein